MADVPGDTFIATLDKELVVDGFVIAERGARVEGRVVAADRGGKVSGLAALSVEIIRLRTADGHAWEGATDGDPLTGAEFDWHPKARHHRIVITDELGRRAWTNPIWAE